MSAARAIAPARQRVADVAEVSGHRPATAGEQAVRWHQRADALDLLAEHEADGERAQLARRDAAMARRLGRGLALTHVERVTREAGAAIALAAHEDTDEEVLGL